MCGSFTVSLVSTSPPHHLTLLCSCFNPHLVLINVEEKADLYMRLDRSRPFQWICDVAQCTRHCLAQSLLRHDTPCHTKLMSRSPWSSRIRTEYSSSNMFNILYQNISRYLRDTSASVGVSAPAETRRYIGCLSATFRPRRPLTPRNTILDDTQHLDCT